jgi:hypothetical protein
MSKILKTSGFLGLAIQMLWGMVNTYLITPGGPPLPPWVVGAHAHFGTLGILAIVLGFAVDRYDVSGTRRTIVTWGFIAGQWLLPANILVAVGLGLGPLALLEYLWGPLLFVSMLIMTLTVWTQSGRSGAALG